MSYDAMYDTLDDLRYELRGEIHDLREIFNEKPHDEELAERIEWLEDACYHVSEAIDAMNGAIRVS